MSHSQAASGVLEVETQQLATQYPYSREQTLTLQKFCMKQACEYEMRLKTIHNFVYIPVQILTTLLVLK